MKKLSIIFTICFLVSTGVSASTWNCNNTDGLKASLSYTADPVTSGRISVESVVVKFSKSDLHSVQVDIPVDSIFDTEDEADSFVVKEYGASLSYVSYEPENGLPSSLLFPKYVINFSGARNELLIVDLRSTDEFHFQNCVKL